MNDFSILQGIHLFKNLKEKHLKAIFNACTERSYEKDSFLIEQGNTGVGLFIILEGTVKVIKQTDDGKRIEVATHGKQEVIGEMSVLDGESRTASVQAMEPTTCLVLSSWDFQSLMNTHPEVALGILPVVVKRFRETNNALLKARGEIFF